MATDSTAGTEPAADNPDLTAEATPAAALDPVKKPRKPRQAPVPKLVVIKKLKRLRKLNKRKKPKVKDAIVELAKPTAAGPAIELTDRELRFLGVKSLTGHFASRYAPDNDDLMNVLNELGVTTEAIIAVAKRDCSYRHDQGFPAGPEAARDQRPA